MKMITPMMLAGAVLLGACDVADFGGSTADNSGYIKELPEEIVAIAAPYQDLTAVRILPDDGCYWYRHTGPVETTLLPLRTVNGNPICTKAEPEPDVVAAT